MITPLKAIFNQDIISKRKILNVKDIDGKNVRDGSILRYPFISDPRCDFWVVKLNNNYVLEKISLYTLEHTIESLSTCKDLELLAE